MDTQGKIIALLQGELRERGEVADLLHRVAASPEELNLFLQQIDLSQRISLLADSALSAPNPARELVRERILELSWEQSPVAGQRASAGKSLASGGGRSHSLLIAGLALVVAAATAWIGYSIGSASVDTNANSVQTRTATTAGASARTDRNVAGNPNRVDRSLPLPESSSKSSASGSKPGVRSSGSTVSAPPTATKKMSSQPPSQHREESLQAAGSSAASSPISSSYVSSIDLLTPHGGELYQPDDIVPIMWLGNDREEGTTIEVSSDGGVRWSTVAEKVQDDRFLWTVPKDAAHSSKYLMRVRPYAPSDVTSTVVSLLSADTTPIALDVSPDERYMVTGSHDATVSVWDRESGRRIERLYGHGDAVHACRYSPDGSKVVTTSLDGTTMIWDTKEWKVEQILDPLLASQYRYVWWAMFSPDGKTVVTAHDHGIIILWDVETGKRLRSFETGVIHDEGVRYIEFTPDGTKLLTASTDRTASITDLRTGKRLQRFVHHRISPFVRFPSTDPDVMRRPNVYAIQLTRDGKTAITCGHDGYVRFWNAETGELIRSRSYHDGKVVAAVRLTPDGKTLVSVGHDGTMALIDLETGGVIDRRSLSTEGPRAGMIDVRFLSDPHIFIVSHEDGQISTWNIDRRVGISGGYWGIQADPHGDFDIN